MVDPPVVDLDQVLLGFVDETTFIEQRVRDCCCEILLVCGTKKRELGNDGRRDCEEDEQWHMVVI
jgi:hypothetical protein